MKKLRLALLFGGVSGEHEVSCLSAASILPNLDPKKYAITVVGISKKGPWYLQGDYDLAKVAKKGSLSLKEDPEALLDLRPGQGIFCKGKKLPLDLVFNLTHGIQGEDGRLQGLLDCLGIPYTGAGVLGSALGMDKALAKQIWQTLGIPVVPFLTLRKGERGSKKEDWPAAFAEAEKNFGLPIFVKPANSGSSVGVAKAATLPEFTTALEAAFLVDGKVLVEAAITAREIEVAVIGGREPQAFGPGEIVPKHQFYDYSAKYLDPDGADLLVPAPLEDFQTKRILGLAVQAYKALEINGYARVDFFLDRKTGQVYLNEINTLPGFTTISMFPRMVIAGGHTYPQLLDWLVDEAMGVSPRVH